MPTPVTRPSNYPLPFASSGTKNTIPTAPTGTGKASFTEGFPAVTMLPLTAGGIPPEGKDFNGILYDVTAHTVWVNAGGQYQFDAALSTAIGGYPAGMVLQNNAGTASYVSAVDNNTTDFNSTPASIGTLWLPYSGATAAGSATITTTGGSTVLNATQAAADFIIVNGALTSNASIIFPASLGKWTVINNTTGAYTVTCYASAGGGVPVLRGRADGIISNGTDVQYATASAVTQAPGDSTKAQATTEFVGAAILAALALTGIKYIEANTALAAKSYYLVNAATAGITNTLPATPSKGDAIAFQDAGSTWGANPWTLDGNGHNIQGPGVNATVLINSPDSIFTVWYNGTEWRFI